MKTIKRDSTRFRSYEFWARFFDYETLWGDIKIPRTNCGLYMVHFGFAVWVAVLGSFVGMLICSTLAIVLDCLTLNIGIPIIFQCAGAVIPMLIVFCLFVGVIVCIMNIIHDAQEKRKFAKRNKASASPELFCERIEVIE